MARFYRLVGTTDDLPLPEHKHLRLGAVIKVPGVTSPRPGAQWNADIAEWVVPVWRECDDPRKGDRP